MTDSLPKRTRGLGGGYRLGALVVIAALFVGAILFALLRPAGSSLQGAPVPHFRLPRLTGTASLSSRQLRGHAVVINFWASWCVPCKKEAPLLRNAHQRYRSKGVRFVGVDINDAPSDARAFVQRFRLTYPMVVGNQKTLQDFRLIGLPDTFFVTPRWRFQRLVANPKHAVKRGTAVLGAISEKELTSNIGVLMSRDRNG